MQRSLSGSRGHTTPNLVAQLLVRGNVRLQTLPFREQQIRYHASKDNSTMLIQVSVVVRRQVVRVSSVFANSVDIVCARLVKIEIQGTDVSGGFDSCDTLILESLSNFVRGVEGTSSKRRDDNLPRTVSQEGVGDYRVTDRSCPEVLDL